MKKKVLERFKIFTKWLVCTLNRKKERERMKERNERIEQGYFFFYREVILAVMI